MSRSTLWRGTSANLTLQTKVYNMLRSISISCNFDGVFCDTQQMSAHFNALLSKNHWPHCAMHSNKLSLSCVKKLVLCDNFLHSHPSFWVVAVLPSSPDHFAKASHSPACLLLSWSYLLHILHVKNLYHSQSIYLMLAQSLISAGALWYCLHLRALGDPSVGQPLMHLMPLLMPTAPLCMLIDWHAMKQSSVSGRPKNSSVVYRFVILLGKCPNLPFPSLCCVTAWPLRFADLDPKLNGYFSHVGNLSDKVQCLCTIPCSSLASSATFQPRGGFSLWGSWLQILADGTSPPPLFLLWVELCIHQHHTG